MFDTKKFLNFLAQKGYDYEVHEHAALFSVEDSNKSRGQIRGAHSKNLFLKNKKNEFFLFSCEEFSEINLKKISKTFSLGNLSFAKEEYLKKLLGIKPGSVTPFALLNDKENKIVFYLEEQLYRSEFLNFHPLTNTKTVNMKTKQFIKFMIENNKKIHIFSSVEGIVIKIYE